MKGTVTKGLRLILVGMILVSSTALSACQPNPEAPIVIGKQDSIEEKIVEREQVTQAPVTVSDSVSEGKATLNIDAVVKLPSVSNMPVVKVVPDQFTQEVADRAIQALMQGQPIYKYSMDTPMSDAEREALIGGVAPGGDMGNPLMSGILRERFETEQKSQLREPSDGKLIQVDHAEIEEKGSTISAFRGQELSVVADLGKARNALLYICTSESGKMSVVYFSNLGIGEVYDTSNPRPIIEPARGMKKTQDEALTIATEAVRNIGADLKLASAQLVTNRDPETQEYKSDQAYIFWFTREVQGVPSTFEINYADGATEWRPESTSDTSRNSSSYIEPYPYERLYVIVNDSGIAELQWISPMVITETLAENAQFMELDDALEAFKTQFFIQNAPKALAVTEKMQRELDAAGITDKDIKQYAFTIDRITLGLQRVAIKDKPNEFLLVPVWDFFGSARIEYNDGIAVQSEMTLEGKDFSSSSFLTINAIDGSIVDRSKENGM